MRGQSIGVNLNLCVRLARFFARGKREHSQLKVFEPSQSRHTGMGNAGTLTLTEIPYSSSITSFAFLPWDSATAG
jgi:hypothetical protein